MVASSFTAILVSPRLNLVPGSISVVCVSVRESVSERDGADMHICESAIYCQCVGVCLCMAIYESYMCAFACV